MVKDIDMSVNLGGIVMKNPVNTASGCFGYGQQFEGFYDVSMLGAITCKGCSAEPWTGNPEPRMHELPSAMMNSVGLQNPGIEKFAQESSAYLKGLEERGCRVILQVAGHSLDEYQRAVELYEEYMPFASGLEINISCPNIAAGGAAMGATCESAASVVKRLRPLTKRPLLIKMAPHNVSEIAKSLEAEGSDALTLINTIPGMAVDTETHKSKMCRPFAGVSGPAIHAIAVHKVWQACNAVKIPVCGIGGIQSAQDAAEMILVGASAVAIGMANFYDPEVGMKVVEGLEAWARRQGVSSISELRGAFEC